MSPNRRIFLNVVATYGRSLVALFCGLFTSRWVLLGLGVEAYGVLGVIGVVITICTTINIMISGSVSRFYAYSFGKAHVAYDKEMALDECRRWFNVALLLHIVFAGIFFLSGVFCGNWAIDNYFNIPEHYRMTAHWVLYFSLISMAIGMLSAPFRAMYIAQQYIAELTIYDFFKPLFTVLSAWWLLDYSGNRLRFYAFCTMVISVVPSLIIMGRALVVFPECKIILSMMKDFGKIRQLFAFAGWQFIGLLGLTLRTQGTPILVNKLLGVHFNSTMTVASAVSGHASSLSSSLNGAFSPAITNAAGAADRSRFYSLSLRSSKFGTLLLALFAIPLCVEIEYIVHLWLKVVPPMATTMCVLILITAVIDRIGMGALVAINSMGDVKLHETLCFTLHSMTLLLCYIGAEIFNLGIVGIGWGLILGTALITVMRMVLWKWQLHLPIRQWVFRFLIPFFIGSGISWFVGFLVVCYMPMGIIRLVVSTMSTILVFCICCITFVLDSDERAASFRALKRLQLRI